MAKISKTGVWNDLGPFLGALKLSSATFWPTLTTVYIIPWAAAVRRNDTVVTGWTPQRKN